MQDTKLFEMILGMQPPWRIGRVALDTAGARVDLWAEHAATGWPWRSCAAGRAKWRSRCRTSEWTKRRFGRGIAITRSCAISPATVEFVAEERRIDSLTAYYPTLTRAQRDGLKALAMDMWEPYIIATRESLPGDDEKVMFDRFHVMQEMTRAVDIVRKQEHRSFLRSGEASPLTGTNTCRSSVPNDVPTLCGRVRHAAGVAPERRPRLGHQRIIADALDVPAGRGGRAVLLTLVRLGRPVATRTREERRGHAQPSSRRRAPVREASITNGVTEGVNSKIMSIKRKAGGFRNAQNFTTAIYFHCGGLDLYPR